MPQPRKFSDFELGEALRECRSRKEICERFGITKGALSKREKQLKLGLARNATMHESGVILKQQIDAHQQLLKINEAGNRWLDNLENLLASKPQEAVSQLKSELEGLREELSEASVETVLEPVLKKLDKLVIYDLEALDRLLKFIAELRQQTKFIVDSVMKIKEAEESAKTLDIIIEEFGRADPAIQERILSRLKGLGIMRQAMGWT
jgi:hypothetical protein